MKVKQWLINCMNGTHHLQEMLKCFQYIKTVYQVKIYTMSIYENMKKWWKRWKWRVSDEW